VIFRAVDNNLRRTALYMFLASCILDMRPNHETSRLHPSVSQYLVFIFHLPLQYALKRHSLVGVVQEGTVTCARNESTAPCHLPPSASSYNSRVPPKRTRKERKARRYNEASLCQQALWWADLILVERKVKFGLCSLLIRGGRRRQCKWVLG
jgi:hypothetical protein